MSVGHSLILPWTHSYKLIERPHFLGTSGIGVKIKSVLKNFWSLVLNFIVPRYTLLFLYSETYIVHVINCEWSKSINFQLRIFCMWYKLVFFHHLCNLAMFFSHNMQILRYFWYMCKYNVIWPSQGIHVLMYAH